jgi:hypothetical protein
MRVKCEIYLEIDTGNYELKLHNLSAPGESIDQVRVRKALEKVLRSWDEELKKAFG